MEQIVLFSPLVGSLIAGFGWRAITEQGAQWVSTGLLFVACFFSWIIFLGHDGTTEQIQILRWIESGTLSTDWSIRLDRLTAIMLIVITSVSALVHLYSFGYMAHDENFGEGEHYKARFFAYLSFFTFAMLMLVTADNLVQMFFGWEGVGLASYLLIGFYYKKPSANAAAIKAFVVNRVGDFGFALGIFALFFLVDSIRFDDIFAAAPELAETQIRFLWNDWNAVEVVAVLLFIGAMGKSAQLFLHTWLPDAMEGPTPVSALIHAATMVTAGVFLVCRMSPLMEFAPQATAFITFLGATTAFVAATIGLVQNDIKRVIAYSTMSQLGYMFVAAGVGVYSVAMFHLFTHAFFKAMLFLGAGSVIHGMHHEQDMRNYGGLRHKLPYTFWAMLIGTLAITGVGIPLTHIGFAGFLSKDAVIESAYAGGTGYAFWLLVVAAGFTSFYSWRLMFLTFWGKPRGNKHTHDHAHESPTVMLVPLGVLAVGAVLAGMVWYGPFFGESAKVAKFFGIPEAHAYEDDHAEETAHGEAEARPVVAEIVRPEAEDRPVVAEIVRPGEAADALDDEADGEGPAEAIEEAADGDVEGAAEAITSTGHDDPYAEGHHFAFGGAPGDGAIYIGPDNHVLDDAHSTPIWVKVSPFIAMLLGLALAYQMYIRRPDWPAKLAENQRPLYNFLLNKWYFDEIYDFVFVRPAAWIGRTFWKRGDGAVIDGGINGLAMGVMPFFTRLAGRAQSGYVFTYAFFMVIGIAILLTWMTLAGGAQ
ncbi:NADH dehydrogenase subunit L [Oceanicola granulosus HTCC2516]|uniref:NADH dehydrogenase subunit L n=1 Tax=Oceanicola granulosus (strain ATCC BAA-861 / DSM 15982 / KCTC 12143 / HTCC2516) TaxID=314256 RepID=Q2CCJ2_OCEGH|nr:NADH-quinone oxidoreductase subunit L [Oceanicola granulosus]EAR50421.1 NADH dehydrogenase subunit L [Oceanicola granulosus HTCC2516]